MRAARDPLTRVSARPLPAQWGDDEDMTLAEAVAVFFPGGLFSVHALRTEAMHGRLTITRIAGKDVVTPSAIRGMRERCRVDQRGRDSTGGGRVETKQAGSRTTAHGLSETERSRSAQAAAKLTGEALKKHIYPVDTTMT